jgi:hypothetical protein
MQCTVPTPPSATLVHPPLAVSAPSLIAAFAHLPAPRTARSVTSALPALLALAVAALLSNHLSVLAIGEWGARQSPDLLRTLGFADGRTPCRPRPLGRLRPSIKPPSRCSILIGPATPRS